MMAMKLIIDTLRDTTMPVVTNFAVELNPWVNGRGVAQRGLLYHLRKTHGSTFDAEHRIFRLPSEEMKDFYLYRPKCVEGVWVMDKAEPRYTITPKGGRKCVGFDVSKLSNGPVHYVLDEAQQYYSSRKWEETGDGVQFFLEQHRKVGDEVTLVCQHTKQCDPALHRVSQDFLVCTNRSKLRFTAFFRAPSDIKVETFDKPPTGSLQTPMATDKVPLDFVGLGGSYDTTAGVGLVGRLTGDAGKTAKGLPFSVLIIGVCLAAVLTGCGLWYGTKYATKVASAKAASMTASAVSMSTNAAAGFNSWISGASRSSGLNGTNVANQLLKEEGLTKVVKPPVTEEKIYCTGVAKVGDVRMVFLSDGSTRSYDAVFLSLDGVKCGNDWYPFAKISGVFAKSKGRL